MPEKLIRDRVPVDLRHTRFALASERPGLLLAKLEEETAELRAAGPEEELEELADLYEVLSALVAEFGYDLDTVKAAADEKASHRGRFAKGLVWDVSSAKISPNTPTRKESAP